MDLLNGTIQNLLDAYRSHAATPDHICSEVVERIHRHNARLGAFLRCDWDGIARAAKESARYLQKPLGGVPIAIKDTICTKDLETTCSSKILEGYVSSYEATAVARLREAGAVVLGKTNCDEFAMGSSTENSAFRIARNPWNAEYAPGGSSGGSVVAVASGMAFGALGSDTGGSIRQPAALCGVVGMKPTYGRVSRYGLVAFGSSLDCIGPIARSVEDTALLLQIIAGHDRHDATSSIAPVPDYVASLQQTPSFRVGVPQEYFSDGIDSDVAASVQDALHAMEKTGRVSLKSISLPHTEYAVAVYYIVATAEASSNLSRFDGVRYGFRSGGDSSLRTMYGSTRGGGFGAEVKRRIMLGTFALSAGYYDAYYLQAMKVRSLIARDFARAFEEVDLICAPTSPTPAFKLGEKIDDPLAMYLSDIYTVTSSLAGLPAISIPCGFSSNNLPIGLQIIGNHFEETKVLQLASLFEKDHPVRLPELL